MTTTWTAVFALDGMADAVEDISASPNAVPGAALYRALAAALRQGGWDMDDAVAEDYGWHGQAAASDQGRAVPISLVTGPNEDAEDNAHPVWRIVVGLDMGVLGSTRARRRALLKNFSTDVQACLFGLGAPHLDWEVGGPYA